jgi:hypothetical protein
MPEISAQMRRVIRKQIRRTEDGLDLHVDVNADIAVNVGRAHRSTADATASEAAAQQPEDRAEGNHQEREDA